MPREILLGFLILCVQGSWMCDWKKQITLKTKNTLRKTTTLCVRERRRDKKEREREFVGFCTHLRRHARTDACTRCTWSYNCYSIKRDHSRGGEMKACRWKERFNFHESSVTRAICFSLSVFLFFMTIFPPSHLSLSVSLILPHILLAAHYEWVLYVCVCVCHYKYPNFRSLSNSIFSFLCKAASLGPHLTTERLFSPLSLPFLSPLPFLLHIPLACLVFHCHYKSFRWCSYKM